MFEFSKIGLNFNLKVLFLLNVVHDTVVVVVVEVQTCSHFTLMQPHTHTQVLGGLPEGRLQRVLLEAHHDGDVLLHLALLTPHLRTFHMGAVRSVSDVDDDDDDFDDDDAADDDDDEHDDDYDDDDDDDGDDDDDDGDGDGDDDDD